MKQRKTRTSMKMSHWIGWGRGKKKKKRKVAKKMEFKIQFKIVHKYSNDISTWCYTNWSISTNQLHKKKALC